MTSDAIRLFVAFDVPEGHLDHLDRAIGTLKEGLEDARWMDPSGRHVTLKFLGWVPAASAEEVMAICSNVAQQHEPVPLRLTSLGAFPSLSRARVLWCGIDDPSGATARIAAALDGGLGHIVEPEDRVFTPHLTLARFRARRDLTRTLTQPDLTSLGPFELDHVTLYRSHLSTKGARYEVRGRFPLRSSR